MEFFTVFHLQIVESTKLVDESLQMEKIQQLLP